MEGKEEEKKAAVCGQPSIHYISSTKSKPLQKFQNRVTSLKITSIGNVDSGKSTLIGVLTKGMADDGRGAARKRVFNYPHEEQSGRTSSIAHEIMGFDENGDQVLPERFVQNKNKYWADVMQNTSKVVTFLDLCGHEKYLKTTIFGLVGMQPDYAMIIVGSNMGISGMTKEHLGISLALKLPFFVVLTKIDICPSNVYQETTSTLLKILKYQNVNRKPIQIKETTQLSELVTVAESMESDRICPIFSVSAVTMAGMNQLNYFISKLKPRYQLKDQKKEFFEFDINENFMVPGVGLVISGVIKEGVARLNQQVQLGPDKNKKFRQLLIRSIHMNRMPVEEAYAGQCACFAVKTAKAGEKLNREDFRKGMVLLDSRINADPVWEFEAEVLILHHATTISPGYQAVLHCGVVRQAAQIMEIKVGDLLRTNDKGVVRFRFMYAPEYLKIGLTVLLREGRTKILGNIVKLIEETQIKEAGTAVKLGKKEVKKLENEEAKINIKNNEENQKQQLIDHQQEPFNQQQQQQQKQEQQQQQQEKEEKEECKKV